MREIILLFLCCALFSGCADGLEVILQPDGVRHRAEYAVPLVDSRTTLGDLVGQVDDRVRLTVDPDGLLRFIYSDTVPAVTSESVFSELELLGRGIPLSITQRRQALAFPLPREIALDELRVKGGQFTYSLPNIHDQPVRIELRIPNATRNGGPLRVTGLLPAYSGSGDPPTLSNTDDPLDISGYAFDFSADSLVIEYSVDDLGGNPLDPAKNTIAVLTNLEFSYLEGYFGRSPYPGISDVLEIDFFEHYLSGEVAFVDPLIRINVRNGFGIPSRAVVDELYIITADGERVEVTGEVVTDGFPFNYPRTEGGNAYTTYLVDKNNSNVLQLLGTKPVALHYRIGALLNPDADPDVVGYLADTSTYSATLDVELPLYGSARDFQVRDTFPINLGESYGEVTEVSFRITTDNELPFDLSLTGIFVDSLGNALADLTDGELLVVEASAVDAGGNSTEVKQTTSDVTFTGAQLEQLRRANRLLLNTTFATTDNGTENVRVTNEQELRVRIGARLTVNNQ
ncbi:hypothetical protein GGR28_003573 [Lewinella aquimaris]|uniref:Uncharacterized protein n=1 Tax=Neolewinella aquimaris TaxID=1835722 RepID=A0A840E5L1_9BACT|nr:hypothetical protein [Neolewinella aquimaris]MBB4080934.1 hypothetical protein [Neolewinella aquimaris]